MCVYLDLFEAFAELLGLFHPHLRVFKPVFALFATDKGICRRPLI